MCRKRYHLIIRAASGSGSLDDGYQDHNKSCSSCGAQLHLSESRYLPVLLSLSHSQYSNSALTLPYCLSIYLVIYRCRSCNCVITADDLEDWAYNQFEDHTHLLHAVVHSNGYAHLLTVNGREGGSLFLSGRHIMDFWDRLSTSLAVRSALLCSAFPFHIFLSILYLQFSIKVLSMLFFSITNKTRDCLSLQIGTTLSYCYIIWNSN